MIVGNIKNYDRYCCLSKNLSDAFTLLESFNKDQELGEIRYKNITGCVKTVNKLECNIKSKPILLEAHKKYIDVHYILDGKEKFGYSNQQRLSIATEYNEKEDFVLYSGDYDAIELKSGDFCIVFPEDAHIPSLLCDEVRRVVLKLPIY